MGYIYFLAVINDTAVNIYVHILCGHRFLVILDGITKGGIAGLYGNSVFNISRNCQTSFQGGCTVLQSHQQHMRVPFCPLSCQYFFLFFNIYLFIYWVLVVARGIFHCSEWAFCCGVRASLAVVWAPERLVSVVVALELSSCGVHA